MSFNNQYLKLQLYSGNLSKVLYICALLIISIPTCIALITDISFGPLFDKTLIGLAYILVIIGKLISILKNKNESKSISGDVGILTGIFIAFVIYISNLV